MNNKQDNIVNFNTREKPTNESMCGYCHLFIKGKCELGHKSVNSDKNCKDLVKID